MSVSELAIVAGVISSFVTLLGMVALMAVVFTSRRKVGSKAGLYVAAGLLKVGVMVAAWVLPMVVVRLGASIPTLSALSLGLALAGLVAPVLAIVAVLTSHPAVVRGRVVRSRTFLMGAVFVLASVPLSVLFGAISSVAKPSLTVQLFGGVTVGAIGLALLVAGFWLLAESARRPVGSGVTVVPGVGPGWAPGPSARPSR